MHKPLGRLIKKTNWRCGVCTVTAGASAIVVLLTACRYGICGKTCDTKQEIELESLSKQAGMTRENNQEEHLLTGMEMARLQPHLEQLYTLDGFTFVLCTLRLVVR